MLRTLARKGLLDKIQVPIYRHGLWILEVFLWVVVLISAVVIAV